MRRFGVLLASSPKYARILERRQGPTGTNLLQIPSYEVRPGQTITLTERMKRSRQMAVWGERGGILPPAYLELDRDTLTGRLVKVPDRDEIPIPVDDRLIVEFYSR